MYQRGALARFLVRYGVLKGHPAAEVALALLKQGEGLPNGVGSGGIDECESVHPEKIRNVLDQIKV
ncbi:hypothetical protein [Rhodococcus marinonascens]|uniref:hypothetical protein n=1 Tax=Rhodococcus marinonascens TaxID=38311 RepID=UPI001472BB82|nr:hypothetical protein [Rhodococcus marinonascens]